MTVGTPTLVTSTRDAAAGTIQSAAFTVAAGSHIFVAAGFRGSSSNQPGNGSISDTRGLTWTLLANAPGPVSGTNPVRLMVWTAISDGQSMQVTTTSGANTVSHGHGIVSVSGARTDLSNINTALSSAGAASVTLPSAPAAASVNLGFHLNQGGNANTSVPAGYTEILDYNCNTAGNVGPLQIVYDDGSPPTTTTWSAGGSDTTTAVVVELKQPTGFSFAQVIG